MPTALRIPGATSSPAICSTTNRSKACPVQRVDDVIAVSPAVGDMPVVLEAFGLGEADKVEPVRAQRWP